jgi:hypothetical protein
VVGEDSTRWIPSSEARKAAENALACEATSQYFAYQPYSINDILDFSERKGHFGMYFGTTELQP